MTAVWINPTQDDLQPTPRRMFDVPTPDWATYDLARAFAPGGIIPLPGEGVLGHVAGMLIVRASNGVEQGWYDYWSDVFYSDAEWEVR